MTMIKKNKNKLTLLIILAILVLLAGGLCFTSFTSQMTKHIENSTGELLDEYASNNAYTAKIELNNALELVEASAKNFTAFDDVTSEEARKILRTIAASSPFAKIIISNTNGHAVDGMGVAYDVSTSEYFKRAVVGESLIMTDDPDLTYDDGMLIISAPIIIDGKVIGTVHAGYDLFSLSKVIETQNLDGESYSIVMKIDGEKVLNSSSEKMLIGIDQNCWDFFSQVAFADDFTVDKLKEQIDNNESGSAAYSYNGEQRNIMYTPIGVNNWYLIKMVTQKHIDSMVQPVSSLVFGLTCIMIAMCVIIALIIIAIIIMVNNSKKLQLQMAYTRAEHANNAKSSFLSRMSHEIRTPMNAIVGLTNIAKEHIDDSEKVNSYLDKIDESSKILLNIIKDVLDMSAIENEKLKIAHEPFDMKELLGSITTVYYAQCRQKGIDFKMNTSEIRFEKLIGDPLRVNQIFLNLISNAYKFTSEGGKIVVSVTERIQNEKSFVHITLQSVIQALAWKRKCLVDCLNHLNRKVPPLLKNMVEAGLVFQ